MRVKDSRHTGTTLAARLLRSLKSRGSRETLTRITTILGRIALDRWAFFLNELLLFLCLDRNGEKRPLVGLAAHGAWAKRIQRDMWSRYSNIRFDRRFGVDTATASLQYEIPLADGRGNGYAPTPALPLVRMLAHLRIDWNRFIFVDLGCGKGKVLLIAGGRPFRRVIGVEMSLDLITVAARNLKSYRGKRRCAQYALVCEDAANFVIPEVPAVFYLYDPFGETVLRDILTKIERSVRKVKRECYLLYFTPNHEGVLSEFTGFHVVRRTPLYSIYSAGDDAIGLSSEGD